MLNSHAIYVDKLGPEYRTVFRQIRDYVFTANLDEIKNEEILSEVLDSFLSAQEEGKPVEQVVGSDLRSFCRQLCSEKSVKNYIIYLFELLHPVFIVFSALCLFDVIDLISTAGGGETVDLLTYRSSQSLSAFLVGSLIWIAAAWVSNLFLKRLIFRYPKKYRLLSVLIRSAALVIMAGAMILLLRDKEAEGTCLWLALTCCAGFLILHRLVTRESRRYRKENRISWMEFAGVSPEVSNDIENTELKRFEKLNRKKRKKKEPELSFEEFLDCEERDCHKWDKKPGFFAGMAVGSSLLAVAFTHFVAGFEQFIDLWVMLTILLAVEGVLMYGLYKLTDIGTRARLGWIRSKRDQRDS